MYSTVQYGTVRNRVYLLRRKLMIRQSGIGIYVATTALVVRSSQSSICAQVG